MKALKFRAHFNFSRSVKYTVHKNSLNNNCELHINKVGDKGLEREKHAPTPINSIPTVSSGRSFRLTMRAAMKTQHPPHA